MVGHFADRIGTRSMQHAHYPSFGHWQLPAKSHHILAASAEHHALILPFSLLSVSAQQSCGALLARLVPLDCS